MVKLNVKKGDEAQFLMETTVTRPIDDLFTEVSAIYNGRLKVMRIAAGTTKSCAIIALIQIIFFPNANEDHNQKLTQEQVMVFCLIQLLSDDCTPGLFSTI